LFVMAWHSDLSDDSTCLQYFQNLGSGTSTIFVVLHSTAHNRWWTVNFTHATYAKQELAVNTLCKVKSVKPALFNTCFVQITKLCGSLYRGLSVYIKIFSYKSVVMKTCLSRFSLLATNSIDCVT
jgi:hypothetical protein